VEFSTEDSDAFVNNMCGTVNVGLIFEADADVRAYVTCNAGLLGTDADAIHQIGLKSQEAR